MMPDFTKNLLKWNEDQNMRAMPWKHVKDPYRIWLSEIILQQTRVEQGRAYYEKFVHEFPTVMDLARASEKKVFKLWEGLGYYSRCRNLIETARKISGEYGGKFPDSYESIAALKGVGSYTAAAIASFAFNLPFPVLDGNVHRVLARYFGITTTMETTAGRKCYRQLASGLLDKTSPGKYNQAIMDFGAMICKPKNPLCASCVLSKDCVSFQNGWTSILPLKKKGITKKVRWFLFFILETEDGQVYIRRREAKDIWRNLYEFPVFETRSMPSGEGEYYTEGIENFLGKKPYSIYQISKMYRQELTHQTIHGQFFRIRISSPLSAMNGYLLIKSGNIKSYPLPRLLNSFLEDAG